MGVVPVLARGRLRRHLKSSMLMLHPSGELVRVPLRAGRFLGTKATCKVLNLSDSISCGQASVVSSAAGGLKSLTTHRGDVAQLVRAHDS